MAAHLTAAKVTSDHSSAKNKNGFEPFLFIVGLSQLGQDMTVTIHYIT